MDVRWDGVCGFEMRLKLAELKCLGVSFRVKTVSEGPGVAEGGFHK